MRPLGIPAYEDRLVQNVMAGILNDIYEERFLDCFYGFRPNRSAHEVVRYINQTVTTRRVNYVLEADIKGFFDNLDQKWLMKFLFQYENEAKAVMRMLKERLGKFGLQLAEDKTRILPIGRYKGTKEDFDFLGFIFYNTKTRRGKYRLGVRTSKKKLKAKKQTVKAWLQTRLTMPVARTKELMNITVRRSRLSGVARATCPD